jgi:hypothetical protein
MELDIFLPNERLAFEYQGQHHYADVYGLGNYWDRMRRDTEKKNTCKESGITLIEIPFWWDGSLESLAATINQQQKGLLPNYKYQAPIATEPSGGFFAGLHTLKE